MSRIVKLCIGIARNTITIPFPVQAVAPSFSSGSSQNKALEDVFSSVLEKYSSNEKGRTQRMASFKKAAQGKAKDEQAKQAAQRAAQLAERDAKRKNLKPMSGAQRKKAMRQWKQ